MTRVLFALLVTAIYAFLLCPLIVVVAASFSSGDIVTFPPQGFSLRWYGEALSKALFTGGLTTSILLGIAAAVGSSVLGVLSAMGLASAEFRGRQALELILLSPLIVPGVVIGIALLTSFSEFGPRGAWPRLLLAHVLLTLPYSVRTVLISLQRLDPALASAAETLGASRARIFFEITLPLIRPGIIAGALFAFVMSFDNVPVSVFLVSADTTTLPLAIMSYLEYNFDPSVAAISTIIILVMLALSLILERIAGLRRVLSTS
ncbi:ABC transporter permease [Acuticoccus sediminis]|uniref:ABC transporter permease n=1 Tax=Acuticoccus sediminis TaxID=2184697 RepID=A0A8B2NNR8_9HYPH|nr:ABC transporter permease [Acuticoccus sediminis]RAH97322.1 ABC transporter permease [Acuticoccus sediminis]